jgi:hypothetical protein
VKRFKNLGDVRNQGFCVHCGGRHETEDHIPPKLWLDDPLPENLALAPACHACNKACSSDEAYLACLLECVIAGSSDPRKLRRPKVSELLASNFKLAEILNVASRVEDDKLVWSIEPVRVRKGILKLARCHAAYEFNEPRLDEPVWVTWMPLQEMSSAQRQEFEYPITPEVWPEVGSRAMSRLMVDGSAYRNGWMEVQVGNYRFMGLYDGTLRVRMVLREYLGCEVEWA